MKHNIDDGDKSSQASSYDLKIACVEGYWVVAVKDDYDEPWQRTILSADSDKEKAMKTAIEHLIELYRDLDTRIQKVSQVIGCDIPNLDGIGKYAVLENIVYPDEKYYPKEHGVGSIAFDDTKKEWNFFFE